MLEQYVLYFRTGNVVSTGDDHVVRAGLVPEVSIGVELVRIACEIPAVLDVFPLLLDVVEVPAAGRPTHGKPSHRAIWRIIAIIVDDLRLISRNDFPCRTRSYVIFWRADEDVEHLRGTDPVDDLQARRVQPRFVHAQRERLTR